MSESENTLQWRFDVNTFKLIGQDLITDRVTALFELVKNCYDANAQNVWIDLLDVNSRVNSKIIIKDDGLGMSFEDIRDKWMVVGTASKRQDLFSPAPYNRRYVGEKGIGRFAVDKLGAKVIIKTKKKGADKTLFVEINWQGYETLSNDTSQISLFTDVKNNYWYEPSVEIDLQGTELQISSVREKWTSDNIERLSKELTKIVSPFYPVNPPFNIFIHSNEYLQFDGKKPIKSDVVDFYSHKAEINFHLDKVPSNSYQEILSFDAKKDEIVIKRVKIRSFGPVKAKLFYFNTEAKKRFNDFHKSKKDNDTRIDGIKIYRDGLVTTPFAEGEINSYKRRDILGIDKRRWRNTFDVIGTREVIGIIEITKENNPQIIDATNRQDFIQNQEYEDLKEFILEQLDIFSEVKKFKRSEEKEKVDVVLKKAKGDAKKFKKAIKTLQVNYPHLKEAIEPLIIQAEALEKVVDAGVKEQQEERKDFERKENIYLSLMSLQEYAAKLSHAVGTSIWGIKDMAQFLKDKYPNPKYENIFKEYSQLIFEEMEKLRKIVEFMLDYAIVNETDYQDFSIKTCIQNLFFKVYHLRFLNENIEVSIEMQDCIFNGNRKFFEDIVQQLISNAIKALEGRNNKQIKCSGYVEDNNYVILFSDNGIGIKDEIKNRIFDLYFTTTAEQGGAGIGLYIVKTRLEALKGNIEVVENELENGATLKVTLPFQKT